MSDQLPTPDWVWAVTPNNEGSVYGNYQGFDEEVPYQLPPEPDPGTFYVDSTVLPMDCKLARRGVKGVLRQVTPNGDIKTIVHLRRGPFGWFAKRWLRDHPLQLTGEIYRPEWGEWRQVIGKVEIA